MYGVLGLEPRGEGGGEGERLVERRRMLQNHEDNLERK